MFQAGKGLAAAVDSLCVLWTLLCCLPEVMLLLLPIAVTLLSRAVGPVLMASASDVVSSSLFLSAVSLSLSVLQQYL